MKTKDIAIAVGSSLFMSLSIVITKMGLGHFPPLLFAALRFLTVIPFLFFLPLPKTSWKNIALVSFCWGIIYLGGIHYALSCGISAGMLTILSQMSTFIGFFCSWIVFQDRLTANKLWGTLLGVCGIFLICYNQEMHHNLFGVILIAWASVSFAIGSIVVKKMETPPFALNIWVNGLCFLPMLCMAALSTESIIDPIFSATFKDWLIVVLAGLSSTVLGGLCWIYVLKKHSMSTVMPFRLLTPVFGILLSTIILQETYEAIVWIGGCLVLLGLAISQINIRNFFIKRSLVS